MCNKKIASGEVPKAYYNALYKTASPASTPKEGRKEGRKERRKEGRRKKVFYLQHRHITRFLDF